MVTEHVLQYKTTVQCTLHADLVHAWFVLFDVDRQLYFVKKTIPVGTIVLDVELPGCGGCAFCWLKLRYSSLAYLRRIW